MAVQHGAGAGEFGHETWEGGSWKDTGHTNVWAPMSLDERRGLVYLPVSTPSNDYFGGCRPGANLFGESIVCLDAATGTSPLALSDRASRIRTTTSASATNLVSMTVDGRRVDAAAQLTKQGLVFVFDRATGKPIWPIEERTVPPSDVAGERAWPTQPFPQRPEPITPQGMTADDVFDLTPELKAAALEELKKHAGLVRDTPPSVEGTSCGPASSAGQSAAARSIRRAGFRTSRPATAGGDPYRRAGPHGGELRAAEVDADFIGNSGGGTSFSPRSGGGGLPT